jgi:manganese efflux pump family protein
VTRGARVPGHRELNDHMFGSLLVLGFTLSLDNFRTALAFGGLPMSWRRSVEFALMFGFWDGVAPLLGILLGRYTSEAIGSTAEIMGAIALGAYGLFLVVHAWLTPPPEDIERPWALYGLLVPLSLDNVVAGTSLGLLGYSIWLAPVMFGVTTAVVAFVGLRIGRAAASFIRIRPDLLTGAALLIMAVVLGPNS